MSRSGRLALLGRGGYGSYGGGVTRGTGRAMRRRTATGGFGRGGGIRRGRGGAARVS